MQNSHSASICVCCTREVRLLHTERYPSCSCWAPSSPREVPELLLLGCLGTQRGTRAAPVGLPWHTERYPSCSCWAPSAHREVPELLLLGSLGTQRGIRAALVGLPRPWHCTPRASRPARLRSPRRCDFTACSPRADSIKSVAVCCRHIAPHGANTSQESLRAAYNQGRGQHKIATTL